MAAGERSDIVARFGHGTGRGQQDRAVNCDTTLAPALRKVVDAYKARFGGHVFVFPTGPGLILPQLVRDIQNDIVVTQVATLRAGGAGRCHRARPPSADVGAIPW